MKLLLLSKGTNEDPIHPKNNCIYSMSNLGLFFGLRHPLYFIFIHTYFCRVPVFKDSLNCPNCIKMLSQPNCSYTTIMQNKIPCDEMSRSNQLYRKQRIDMTLYKSSINLIFPPLAYPTSLNMLIYIL